MTNSATIKKISWNIFGVGFPMAVAIFLIPELLHGYGRERFGLLSLVWVIIGYFSIFDFGIGRALTKLVAEKLEVDSAENLSCIIYTALTVMLILGGVAAVTCYFSANIIVSDVLKLKENFLVEGRDALKILAFGLPFAVISSAFVGVLEACGKFKEINKIKVVMGVGNFILPYIAMKYGNGLTDTALLLVFLRIYTAYRYYKLCLNIKIITNQSKKFDSKELPSIFKFGAWITVSNIISPIMVELDKLLIGSSVGVGSLPAYSIPMDMINRISFIPTSIIGVYFPEFSKNNDSAVKAYVNCVYLMGGVSVLIFMAIISLSDIGLSFWISEEFSKEASGIVFCLACGFLFNSVARIPYALLQGSGYPNITAIIHIIELPIYAMILYIMLNKYGIVGAAFAWSFRMFMDFLFLSIASGIKIKNVYKTNIKAVLLVVALASMSLIYKYYGHE